MQTYYLHRYKEKYNNGNIIETKWCKKYSIKNYLMDHKIYMQNANNL